MKRLQAVFFLLLAPLIMAPGLALAWARVRGMVVTMDPMFELILWAGVAAGLSTIVYMTVVLLRGR